MKRLGDFIKLVGGGTPSKSEESYWNGEIPWMSVKDLKSDIIANTQDCITKAGLENSSAKLLEAGTIIIATRMAVGKPAITKIKTAINQDLKGILIEKDIDKLYLFYLLKSKKEHFESVASGATVKGIKISAITDLKIPLPPLPEQKKIAAILDAADAYRQKTKALIEKYDELTQSLFLEMFGDPVTNPKGWEVITIRDIIDEAKYGTSSKAEENGQYPYLRMNNITYKGYMDYSSLKYISIPDNQLEKYQTKPGDVLFNRTNSKELVGKTGIVRTDRQMILAGYLIRVRVKKGFYNPYFLWAHLNSKWSKLTLEKMCKNIVGMANINAQELQNIPIVDPPYDLQNQFAERIQKIEAQKAKAQASLEKAETLFNSLLQRAFKGELTAK